MKNRFFGVDFGFQRSFSYLLNVCISEWLIFFSLFLFQKGCLIAKRMKDGGLGLFDEKLISGRLKYDHSGIIHLFTENVLDQFFSNIWCDSSTDNFASFQNFEDLNQLNPIRIGCSRAFAFHARWLHWHEGHPRDQFLLGVLAAGKFLYLWNMNFPMVCLTSDDGAMVVF